MEYVPAKESGEKGDALANREGLGKVQPGDVRLYMKCWATGECTRCM